MKDESEKLKELEEKVKELTPKDYDVEFVSYKAPRLAWCLGKLIVKINGVKHSFEGHTSWGKRKHPRFWISGGDVTFDKDWNEHVTDGPWKMLQNKEDFTPDIWDALPKVLEVMNANTIHGCCGGCV